MVRQQKQERKCPKCGAALKKTIGPVTRQKYLECTRGGIGCYKVMANEKA